MWRLKGLDSRFVVGVLVVEHLVGLIQVLILSRAGIKFTCDLELEGAVEVCLWIHCCLWLMEKNINVRDGLCQMRRRVPRRLEWKQLSEGSTAPLGYDTGISLRSHVSED